MAVKPGIPKGTRDFNPQEVGRRHYIMNVLREAFENFGFQPIETPSFENLETLTGKYGEEGDRLIFKIFESGDFITRNIQESKYEYDVSIIVLLVDRILLKICKEQADRDIDNNTQALVILGLDEKIKRLNNNIFKILNQDSIEAEVGLSIYAGEFENFIYPVLKETIETILPEWAHKVVTGDRLTQENYLWRHQQMFRSEFESIVEHVKNGIAKHGTAGHSNKLASLYSDKALRYDLTVPFARYVAQHRNELAFPFKRYQMQPVWRADRPQKGRFREFWQCDADVVGSDSLWQEVEFVQLYDRAFTALGLKVSIHLNNRKVLAGIADVIGAGDRLTDFTVALDKLDKIGAEKVVAEMADRGIPKEGTDKLLPLLSMNAGNDQVLNFLSDFLKDSETGLKGVEEVRFVLDKVQAAGLKSASVKIDLTLARGLDYYTGAILEVKADDVELGSIGGGGRYDDLTGIFDLNDMSGMGVSFGLDRIYLCLEELSLFPENAIKSPGVLFFNMGEAEMEEAQKWVMHLRDLGISAECYPDQAKFKKQFDYADKRGTAYVAIIGEDELKEGVAQIKDQSNGEQQKLSLEDLVRTLQGS